MHVCVRARTHTPTLIHFVCLEGPLINQLLLLHRDLPMRQSGHCHFDALNPLLCSSTGYSYRGNVL
jgi:hypothetical protein